MSMQLISEELLKQNISQIEKEGINEQNKFLYNICKKELTVIQKLKINKIDMCGEIREVQKRIEKQALYFMDAKEFEEMEEKARKYDEICKIIGK